MQGQILELRWDYLFGQCNTARVDLFKSPRVCPNHLFKTRKTFSLFNENDKSFTLFKKTSVAIDFEFSRHVRVWTVCHIY